MGKQKRDIPIWGVLVLGALLTIGFILQGIGHYKRIQWLLIVGNASLIIFSLAGIAAAFGEWWAPIDD